MLSIQDKVEGDLLLNEHAELHGTVTGTVTVPLGVKFRMRGTVLGNVVVESGSEVYIYGTVSGTVVNRGGFLKIFGTVGQIARESGTTLIAPV